MDILDAYILKKPSQQNVLDIFQGEWSSQFPDEFQLTTEPGRARLFEDGRVVWTEQVFGSLADWKILELGPLEAGHSYMFQARGAEKVTAIEANTRSFLKCLCVKEILGLDRVEFKLGDFVAQLEAEQEQYDLVFASGVLYHMEEPLQLLKLISEVSRRLFVWTHYYDEAIISATPQLQEKFQSLKQVEFEGNSYQLATQAYNEALDWSGFCGGPQAVSKWLTRDSLLQALSNFGYTDIQENFDHPDHPNGPAIALCVQK